ncbi:MAG: DMT family transporter [Deltaproteobacteria bacterium]|nr:DMT family transporter [Deltaproteobacteria bacterium]
MPAQEDREDRRLKGQSTGKPLSSLRRSKEGSGLPPLGIFLLISLTLFWGLNWPIMKIALMEIPPWTFRTLCLVLGGIGLMILARAKGLSLAIPRGELKPLLLVASMNITGWHILSAHGLSRINASRATIIAFTMPIWATLLGRLVLGEKLSLLRLLGLGFGIGGLFLLIAPELGSISASPAGSALMLGAAVSWAMGTVAIKHFKWTMAVSLLTAWQLLLGGIPVVAGAILFDPLDSLLHVSPRTILASTYVILLPIIYCQWAWFKVVSLFPAAVAAIGTLAIPVIGVLSSALILSEPVGLRELAALALVVTALLLVMVKVD